MEKVCIKCNVSKDLSNFHSSKSYKDGKMGTCKSCFNVVVSRYRLKSYHKNKEKIKERGRKWRSEQQNYYKQWKLNNLEHVKDYAKTYKKTPLQKLKANIRTRIAQHISGFSKSKSTLDILGLESFEQLPNELSQHGFVEHQGFSIVLRATEHFSPNRALHNCLAVRIP